MSESEMQEYKKTLGQLKEGIISMVAMLNKHGSGVLWFGIRDDGRPVGIDVGNKTVRDISQAIGVHVEPRVYPEITTRILDGKQCVKVAFSGYEKPYSAYGRYYIRVADEDRQLSAQELENFILQKNSSERYWDSEKSTLTINDLDVEKIKSVVERAGVAWHSPTSALENFDLLENDILCNAASVFFQKKPPLTLRCAVFGTETTSFIIDRQDFTGTILELVEEAQKYILKNIHIGMRLEGLYRVDVPEIALPALREAVINAFCHRDYRDADHVQVAIFKNRVEIRNPGKLFGGLTINNLRKGKVSRRRNPLIAQVLMRIHMIEAWGRGMALILENEPTVHFEEIGGIFIASFMRPSAQIEEVSAKTGGETGRETSGETGGEKTSNHGKELHKKLSDKESAIVQTIAEIPTMTQPELAAKLGLTLSGIRYHMDKLKKKGIVRHMGSSKKGYWEII